jgi:hypothetical protein
MTAAISRLCDGQGGRAGDQPSDLCGIAEALARFGVPEEVQSDDGKQFTDRFGKGGEVMFDRISARTASSIG